MNERGYMLKSKSNDWETPKWLYDKLDCEFVFTLDPCATEENAKCEEYFTKEQDGLKQDWTGNVFVNPPFKDVKKWVEKAWEEVFVKKNAKIVVMLIAARTDTRWFHEYIWSEKENEPRPCVEIRFIKGRLKYGDGKAPATFPSMIVIFSRI